MCHCTLVSIPQATLQTPRRNDCASFTRGLASVRSSTSRITLACESADYRSHCNVELPCCSASRGAMHLAIDPVLQQGTYFTLLVRLMIDGRDVLVLS